MCQVRTTTKPPLAATNFNVPPSALLRDRHHILDPLGLARSLRDCAKDILEQFNEDRRHQRLTRHEDEQLGIIQKQIWQLEDWEDKFSKPTRRHY
jgi:hypothetical protein